MAAVPDIVNNIFSVDTAGFNQLALEIFNYQYACNAVYATWVNAIGTDAGSVNNIAGIPFMPVSFFKDHRVTAGIFEPGQVFESSGTTGVVSSMHLVKDLSVYTQSFVKGFELFYGNISEWCIIGLLPAYLERKGSSLVMMTDELIKRSGHKGQWLLFVRF